MNIGKQTFNTLDVLYDDKKWGKRIDPDEWNANFKVLEEGHNELATKLNQQVTDIDTVIQAATSNGGQNISVQYGVGTETLQNALDNVVSDINNRYTKNEVDASIGSNTNSLIVNAEYNESTGVFTFTRKDGSSVVIDTVIEKVPASMALVNESDGSVSLVVTNQDGSTTKTNVTSLIEDTIINSSDTVNATYVTDAVKKVTTYTLVIKPNSIGLSHIDSALTAKFEETQSAKTAAVQAKDSAVAAKTAAVTAQKSAETYASNANTYSTNASISADESADSALEAKVYAEQASSYKNSAELAKTAAIQAKNDSETAKTDAQTAATEASKSEAAAEQSATSASQSASSASQSATSASNSSTSALQSKEAAALSETNSLANKNASAESASAAATSETNAASSALAAQTAQTAAEKARDEAQAIAGGDYVTKVELNSHTNNTTLHFTDDEKTKLSGIEPNSNNYIHPSSHPANIITEDSTHRFVTDTDKTTWNNKASTSVVTTTSNGLMIASDKSKLDGIATGANNYVHPTSHPASIIVEDSTHRFVTDAEKAAWSEKEVFIATYGVTSFIEIANARDNGKVVYVKQNNYYFPMTYSYESSVHRFTGFIDSKNGKNIFCSNSGWGSLDMHALPTVTTNDNGKILQVVNGVWTAVNNLSTVSATTLLASNWDSTAKIYSFEADYPSASYDIEVSLDGDNATNEQLNAWIVAKMLSSSSNKIIAKGTIPTIDIPIILVVKPKSLI